jgi:hypothetical protein
MIGILDEIILKASPKVISATPIVDAKIIITSNMIV